tara:strand:+ start:1878 stop:2531 length:654 start_codon:yes stop_codon:yes gene_type:complete
MNNTTKTDIKGSTPTSNDYKTNTAKFMAAKMLDWLWIFRIFILVGITIFTIGQIAGTPDGEYAAYIWFTIGLMATWIVSLRIAATSDNEKNTTGDQKESFISRVVRGAVIMLPNIGTLVPLVLMVFISGKIRSVLETDYANLPSKYFWFNKFVFFLIVLQLFILDKFYDTENRSAVLEGTASNSRSIYLACLILFSVLSSAAAVELYVITTSFITDG